MKRAVAGFVGAGVAAALYLGIRHGFDATAIVILLVIVAVGLLGVVVAARFETGGAQPARCAECGGVISPHAPYCKHCGAPGGAGGGV